MGRRGLGMALLGLFIGAAVVFLLLTPRIISVSPTESTDTAWPDMTVHFNRPIDKESLSDHLHISPPIDGQVIVTGKKASFIPAKALDYGQIYSMEILPGVRGINGLPLIFGTENTFTVSAPRIAYLQGQNGSASLWTRNDTGLLQQISRPGDNVWDFEAVSERQGILYSGFDSAGDSGLWLLKNSGETELLLDCQENICLSATWQPGGRFIAYERQPSDGRIDDIEVWLLDVKAGQTWPAYDKSLLAGSGFEVPTSNSPRWSSDGRYLSFFKPDARVIIVLDFDGGPAEFLPANLELMGDWSPNEYQLAFSELAFGQQFDPEHDDEEGSVISQTQPSLYHHTVLADFVLDETTDISQGKETNDGQPAWNPTGDLLATSRSVTGDGRQIWLLPMDGSDAYPITDDPYYDHSSVSWSPDGKQLVYMRTGLADGSVPEIWLLDVDTGQQEFVVSGGFIPKWLP